LPPYLKRDDEALQITGFARSRARAAADSTIRIAQDREIHLNSEDFFPPKHLFDSLQVPAYDRREITVGIVTMAKQPDTVDAHQAPVLSNTAITPTDIELNKGELSGISGGDAVVVPIKNRPTILFTTTTKDKVDTYLDL
jgi:hypothetical protein